MVRDLAIQKQMDDLVIGTFGRSIYVLDDYSPLRAATPEMMQKESALFPVRKALEYHSVQSRRRSGHQSFHRAESAGRRGDHLQPERRHPHQGAGTPAARARRPPSAARRRLIPRPKSCAPKSLEEPPAVILTIKDAKGKIVRRLDEPATAGIHRVTWDLRSQGIGSGAIRYRLGGGGCAAADAADAAAPVAVVAGAGGGGGDRPRYGRGLRRTRRRRRSLGRCPASTPSPWPNASTAW